MRPAHANTLPRVLQGLPSMAIGLEAKWSKSDPTSPPEHPALPFNLSTLSASLSRVYKLLTEGKFADCLTTLDSMLLSIPLTTVDTRQEVDELKELLSIVREYHIAVRCELARRQVCRRPLNAAQPTVDCDASLACRSKETPAPGRGEICCYQGYQFTGTASTPMSPVWQAM